MQQWIAIVFFVVGSLWGARDFGWWTENVINRFSISDGINKNAVHLPNILGWAGAFFSQLLLLAVLFIAAEWFEYRKFNTSQNSDAQNASIQI